MSFLSSKPLKQLRQQYIVLLLGVLIFILALSWWWAKHDSRTDVPHTLLGIGQNIAVSVVASIIFILLISARIDKEYRKSIFREIRIAVDKTISKVAPAFAPSGVYKLSDEEDTIFHDALLKDLGKSKRYFFSGLSARVALARLSLPQVGVIHRCIFRLPLSESSLNRALSIFHDVRAKERSENPRSKHNSELFGFEGDRKELLALLTGEDFTQHKRYIQEIVNDSILFAYHMMIERHWTIDILDWDDFTESRVEFMESAVYIGNYHPLGQECHFGPGTLRFEPGSFVWVFLSDGIEPQFGRCDSAPSSKRLRFSPADSPKQAKENLCKFIEDPHLVDAFSPQLAAERFSNFTTCAYIRGGRNAK